MSKPMTAAETLAAFKAEGLSIVEYSGWKTRCRCCPDDVAHRPNGPYIRGWGDVDGQLAHITAGALGGRSVEKYIRDIINGDPNTPCKSQTVIAPDGRVYLNSTGRCNHAGKVGSSVRGHMRAADFSTSDDFDNRFTGGSADGNSFTYGDEVIAASKMNAAQYDALVRVHAARARHHGWNGRQSVGHGEVSNQRGKGDPNLDMGSFRRDVMARLKSGATAAPKPTPPPVAPKPTPAPAPKPTGPTVTSSSLNAGSYNAPGAATYKARTDRYTRRRMASQLDVLDLQEVGNGPNKAGKPNCEMRDRLDDRLDGTYRRHIGGDGRYCYSNTTRIKPIKSGLITAAKSTWFNGDDKQGAYLVFEKDGVRGMDVSFHLEHRPGSAPDAKRVQQMLSIVKQALAIAKANGVDVRNILFVGDTNSEGMVAAAMLKAGWRNVATGTKYENRPTFIDWDGRGGKRFDYGFVHITAGPAEFNALHADPDISDHAELVIKRTLTRV